MKLVALIVASFAALAPMQTFASTGSDQTSVRVASLVSIGEPCSNDGSGGLVNVNVQACDIDIL